ncbi:hypothetical protein QJQ45_014207, partial [Haematococcus lacustris]
MALCMSFHGAYVRLPVAKAHSPFSPRGRLIAMGAVPIGRRILFELDELYYPIGNTKAVSWLGPHPFAIDTSGHCRVLSLACGDPRNLLLTLGSLSPPGPSATATPDPVTKANSCSYLELHANDHNPSIIARNMVLLALATEVDPASPTDMQLLFDVWYNLLWDKGSQVEARFKATIQHILDGRWAGSDALPATTALQLIRHDLSGSVSRLLACLLLPRYPWMQVPRPNDVRKVHEVLRWWLEDAGQSTPAHVLEMLSCLPAYRRLQRTKKFATSAKAPVQSFDLDATDKYLAEPLLCETLPFNAQSELLKNVMAKRDGGSSSVGEVLKADFVAWAQLGSLRGHQEQQWSKSTAKTAVVNCTMLPAFETPVSCWTAHYDQQFMRAWAPLELHELQAVARPDQLASALQTAATAARASPAVEEAPLPGPWGAFPPCPAPPVGKAGARPEYRPALLNQTYKAGMLARACMVRMAAACVAMQRNARLGRPEEVVPAQLPPAGLSRPGDSAGRSGVPAQLCFWLGDCLQLCQGPDLEQHWAQRPAAQPTVVEAPQQAQQGQPGPQPPVQPPLMFHVIDTSNVADHSGLLNLLLAAQPRLVSHPLARLITCSMTWTMSFKSMREYLQRCLSCPPSMYPTLLGLRLVTDITAGRPQPLGMAALLSAIRQDPRLLVWSKPVAAVGTTALSLALMLGQQQLMAAGRLQCKDPQPGPGLAGGEKSLAAVQASKAALTTGRDRAAAKRKEQMGDPAVMQIAAVLNQLKFGSPLTDIEQQGISQLWQSLSKQPISALEYDRLAELAMVMVRGSVVEERMCSAMAYLKDDTRNRLNEEHLNGLMTAVGAQLPRHWQLGWRAVQADLVGRSAAALAAQPGGHTAAAGGLDLPQGPGLLHFTKVSPVVLRAHISSFTRGTPILRALLLPVAANSTVSAARVPSQGVLDQLIPFPLNWDERIMAWAALTQSSATSPPAGVHILDNLSLDEVPGSNRCQWTLSLLLPADHGLNLGGTAVVVMDALQGEVVLQPTRLSSFNVEQVTPSPDLVTLLLQSAGAGLAAGPGWAVAGCGGQPAASSDAAQCCAQCGAGNVKLFRCSRCREVTYCSPACQKKHWKAHKAACHAPADASSHTASTPSQPAGATSEQAGPVASKHGQAAASLYSWAVAEAIETSSSYSLILQLTSSGTTVRADCEPGGLSAEVVRHWDWQPGSSSSSSSGPTAKGSRGKAPELLSLRLGVTTSHFIALRLERPAGVRPLLLQLPWPISSGANEPDGMPLGCYSGGQGLESVQLRRKSGQVWLKLRKAEEWERWPADAPTTLLAAPPQHSPAATPLPALLPTPDCIDITHLRPLDLSSGTQLLANHMVAMYSRQQMVQQASKNFDNGDAETELRESIKNTFVRATEGVRFIGVENMAGQPLPEGCSAELFVLLHLPIQEGPDGGPILPITVVDNRNRTLNDFQQYMMPYMPEPILTLTCTHRDELMLLRRMIFRNALRCKPTSSQKRCLPQLFNDPSGSPWFASYLSPRYAEHLGERGQGRAGAAQQGVSACYLVEANYGPGLMFQAQDLMLQLLQLLTLAVCRKAWTQLPMQEHPTLVVLPFCWLLELPAALLAGLSAPLMTLLPEPWLVRLVVLRRQVAYCVEAVAVSWLGPHPFAIDHSGHCRVLSLACGDPRNLLLTLGSLSPPGPSATATPDPAAKASSCSYLELHANDHNPSIIARNMVLLALATEVDPASPTDMQLLFDVWYNLLWDKGSQVEARFKATIQHILDGRYPWMQVPRPSDMRKVHEVLRWWLEEAGQSTPAHVLEMLGRLPAYRRLQRTKRFATSDKATVKSFDLDATDKSLAKSLLYEVAPKPWPGVLLLQTLPFNAQSEMLESVLAKCDGGSSSVGEVLKADFVAWAQLGSLRGHQEQQWSKSTAKSAVVNCTVSGRLTHRPVVAACLTGGCPPSCFAAYCVAAGMQMLPAFETPVSCWPAHYDLQFMRCWAPLELHELQAVARPDQLASALQTAATAARASPAVEEAPLPGPWGAFPPCPAPPVDKAGVRPEYRPALLNQTYKAGMLARACMVRMAAACMAMQRNARLGGPGEVVPMQLPPAGHSRPGDSAGRSGVPAQLCFWLGDCLQLCQGPDLEQHWAQRPAAQPTVVEAPQQAQQGQPGPQPPVQPPLMFHVIDTSNVADHSGLLNLLLAAQPRLVSHPLARLITCSMTWTLSFTSKREYLQSCLSCPPSMYPTLLGLRLVTDITAGRPQPLGMAALLRSIRQDPRLLVWSKPVAAVGTTALSLALLQGQQQLMAAGRLQCKDPQSGPGLVGGEGAPFRAERCGLLCTTPASLAHLLLSGCAAGRFTLLPHTLPTSQPHSSSPQLLPSCSSASTPPLSAAGQPVLHQCQELMTAVGAQLPRHWQLGWRAVQADLVGRSAAALAAQPDGHAAAAGGLDLPQGPGLLRFTKVLPVVLRAHIALFHRGTPILRALLLPVAANSTVSAASVPSQGVLDQPIPFPLNWDERIMAWAALTQSPAPVPPAGVHILDSLTVSEVPGSNRCQWTLSLLLPTDHGLDLRRTAVLVLDAFQGEIMLQPTRLSSFKVEQVKHSPALVTLLLQSAAAGWAAGPEWSVAGCGGQSAAGSGAAQCCAQCGTAGEKLLKCGRPWKGVLDEQDPIPSDWDKHILTWASPIQYDAPVPPAGVHILDSLTVNEVPGSNRCQWTLSLLLPADHGLNLGGTAVVVIDLQNRARVLQPTRLSSFKVEQVTHKPDLVTLLLQSAAAGWAAGPEWSVAGCGGQSAAGSEAAQCCAQCGTASEELLKCGRCREVTYCSPACQKKHWKAHKATCHAPADAASQSASTPSKTAGAASEQAGPVASKQGQAAASPYSWAVAEAIETHSSYSLILQLISSGTAVRADCEPGGLSAEVVRHWDWQSGSSSSSGGSSGPSVKGSQGKASELLSLRLGVTTSHFIALRLERPAGVRPLLLQLPWPISSGANEPDGMPLGCYSGGQGLESVQLRRKSGQVWLKLRKAEEWERWPADAPPTLLAAPPQHSPAATLLPALLPAPDCIDISRLRPLDLSSGKQLLALHINTMSTRQQMMQQASKNFDNGDAETELRESIKTLFIRASEGVRSLGVGNMAGQSLREGCSAELFVLLHLPIQDGPDGGPILPITVVDNRRGQSPPNVLYYSTQQMYKWPSHTPSTRALNDFQQYMMPHMPVPFLTVRCTHRDELMLLRRWVGCVALAGMIFRNALRCKPTSSQKRCLPQLFNDPSRSPWFASYVCPRYAEHL